MSHNGEGERGKASGKKSKKKGRQGGEDDKRGKKKAGDTRAKSQERETAVETPSNKNEKPSEATETVEQGASGDSSTPAAMRLVRVNHGLTYSVIKFYCYF